MTQRAVFTYKDHEFTLRELRALSEIMAYKAQNPLKYAPSHDQLLILLQGAGEKVSSPEQITRVVGVLRLKGALRKDVPNRPFNLMPTPFGEQVVRAWKKALAKSDAAK